MEEQRSCQWLLRLLKTNFYGTCKEHNAVCVNFCKDCAVLAICDRCRQTEHADHVVLRVYLASHYEGFRDKDISNLLDICDVQRYSINGGAIVYIRRGPGGGCTVGNNPRCEACERTLNPRKPERLTNPIYKFCSIQCKFAEDINVDEVPWEDVIEESSERNASGDNNNNEVPCIDERVVSPKGKAHPNLISSGTRQSFSLRRRRRKGVPRRAPFF